MLNTSGKYPVIITGILLVALIGVLDFFTGSEVSFSIFYLIPLTYISWNIGRNWGFVFAVLSAITWFVIDAGEAHDFSVYAVHYWNGLVRFGFFVIVVYLVTEIKNYKMNLEEIIKKRTSDLQNEIIEHEKAKNEIIKKSNQLRELTRKIETIKEEEDIKIAREIHDELGQFLTAINLEVMWINKKYSDNPDLNERTLIISSIVNNTLKSIRKISLSLRPRLLDQLGLLPAMESLAKEFQGKTGIRCITNFPEYKIEMTPNASTTMFRIFQEALTNVARHSKATAVFVNISKAEGSELIMTVKDNGSGIDLKKSNGDLSGLGVLGMKERAHNLGGRLELVSKPGSGTEVLLRIPIELNTLSL